MKMLALNTLIESSPGRRAGAQACAVVAQEVRGVGQQVKSTSRAR